jgi:menaquinone-9 beta-reductase
MSSSTVDVVVIGAGPGGSATAHDLAKTGIRVALLDKRLFPRDKTCGDGLTPRAVGLLRDMGLLDTLLKQGRQINRFEVVAPNRTRTQAPIPASQTLPALSLVVPRLVLDAVVRNHALASGAIAYDEHRVDRVEADDTGVSVHGDANGSPFALRAQMAVIATGANSGLLLKCGLLKQQPETMVATRAYYENVQGLSDVWELRFDGVPLPGYGWIFPTGEGTANIGAGYFAPGRATSAQKAFESFVSNPALNPMLANARQVGPARGYPLRADFTTAPTHAPRILAVGEAAGLVNPLTGEGIDYALESGRIAAAHLHTMFATGSFGERERTAYDHELREHFQSLFEFCMFTRDRLCGSRFLLNALVAFANRRADLRTELATVVLGGRTIRGKLTLGRVVRKLTARATA